MENKPTVAEMSQKIWEWMGNCWHAKRYIPHSTFRFPGIFWCDRCGHEVLDEENPDLTLDENLHLVRLAELKAVEVFGEHDYTLALLEALRRNSPYGRESTRLALASAAQRTRALYNKIKESEK